MGLFSSKKKTYVNTTVQAVFQENQIPNSLQTGVFKAVLNSGDMTDYMLEESLNSINIKADAGFNWAKRNYTYGVPQSSLTTSVSAQSVVMHTLASLLHTTLTQDYYLFGPLNSLHWAWTQLVELYGYNGQTNELMGLSASTGYPVYLANIVATYRRSTFDSAVAHSDTGVFAQWGPAPSSGYRPNAPMNTLSGFGQYAAQSAYEVSDTSPDDYVTITYQFKDGSGAVINRGLTLNMQTLDLDSDYHQVRYVQANGHIGFFSYKDGAGTYPEIDSVQSTVFTDVGTYYPWTYMRFNKQNLGADALKTSKPYLDSVKWCNYLGVTYQTLVDGVQADQNVDDVQQALMLFGVDANAQSQVELEYLFNYFTLLYENGIQVGEPANSFSDFSSSPAQAQVIQDAQFRMTLSYAGIKLQRRAGTLGVVGTCTGALLSETSEVSYTNTGGRDGAGLLTQTINTPYYCYCKQVTTGVYEEVRVYNPSLYYQIGGSHGMSAGPGTKELLIPLDRAVVNGMSFRKREQVMCRALHMVVNTLVVVKSPWYSSGWFKVVMIIIAIAIAFFSAGGLSGISAAIAAATVTSVAIAIVEYILISMVISYGLKIFVKVFGPEAGLIAAIALMAVGGYEASTAPTESLSAVWGERLLMVGSNLAKASTTEYGNLIQGVQQDMTDFGTYATGQFDALKTQQDQLGLNAYNHELDFVTLQPMVVWGESPNDLYARTVHSGNIGVVSYDLVSGYVGQALTLPKLNQVEEDFTHGSV